MFFEGLCGEISIFCGGQTTDDKTNCLTPLRACARGVKTCGDVDSRTAKGMNYDKLG